MEKTKFVKPWDSRWSKKHDIKQMYYYELQIKGFENLDNTYNDIVQWLEENCAPGWEAKWEEGIGFGEWFKILVFFEMEETEADRMAFKLRWL